MVQKKICPYVLGTVKQTADGAAGQGLFLEMEMEGHLAVGRLCAAHGIH